MKQAKIKEIFSSIQGEGPVVGYMQLFIRFCGCNLKCNYCDTDFISNENTENFTPAQLYEKISNEYDLFKIHSISLTGGEPLLSVDFLEEFLPLVKKETKIYLETNATLSQELLRIKNQIDIISADIKLPSSTGNDTFDKHIKFFEAAKGISTFAKIVFDNNITDEEITKICEIAKIFNLEIVLQPKMIGNKMSVNSEFCTNLLNKILNKYPKARLIPQVHKFLNVR